MSKFLKKYWFVTLIGILLIGIIAFYTYNANKGKIAGKKIDGKSIVYSIGDKNVSADELYDSLFEKNGLNSLYFEILKTTSNEAIETTKEMEELAASNIEQIKQSFYQSYGESYEEKIVSILRQTGYTNIDDLDDYLIQMQKTQQIISEYIEANKDTLVNKYIEERQPRLISHILVKMADSENPTQEELDKMETIKKELAEGKSFEEVASTYSDDTGSAANGGSLGIVDNTSSLVSEFLSAMLTLNENETTDWVKTEYGYHLIKNNGSTYDTLKTNEGFLNSILNYDPKIEIKAIYSKAKELGLSFKEGSDLEEKLLDYLGIKDME